MRLNVTPIYRLRLHGLLALAAGASASAAVVFAAPAEPSAGGAAPAAQAAPADSASATAQQSSLGEHLDFTLDAGRLTVKWKGDARSGGQPVKVRRPTAKLTLRPSGLIRDGGGEATFVTVARQGIVAGTPPGFIQMRVPTGAVPLSFSGHNLSTPLGGTFSLEFSSTPRGVRASVTRTAGVYLGRAATSVLDASARDLSQLAAEHPDEVRIFVAPILQEITGLDCFAPGAGDVYRAFDHLKPDPAAALALTNLLPRLDDESYAVRSEAGRELRALGPAGVLAALRAERRGLSAEQNARVEGFIASHVAGAARTPAAARRDAEFLLQCLRYDDPAVRTAAKRALGELSGRRISFDPDLAGQERADAADKLRVELLDVVYPGVTLTADPPDPDESRAFVFQTIDPEQQRQQIRQMRLMETRMLGQMKKADKPYRLAELLEFRRGGAGGMPKLKWTRKLMTNQPLRVDVKGARGNWLLYRAAEFRQNDPDVMIGWSDPTRSGDEGPWRVTLNFANEYASVSGMYGEDAGVYLVSLHVSGGRVMLNVQKNMAGMPDVQAQGGSLKELLDQYPGTMRKYVLPMLRDVFGIYFQPPDASLAYAAFPQIAADPAVMRRLADEILPALDADTAAQRDAAAEQLYDLGRPGVLAALRMPRDGLSLEQNGRLNRFLADTGGRGGAGGAGGAGGTDADPAASQKDVPFLLACLEFDDPAVRAAAKAALETVTARPVDLDPNLEGDARTDAVEALRLKLEKQLAGD